MTKKMQDKILVVLITGLALIITSIIIYGGTLLRDNIISSPSPQPMQDKK